MTGNCSQVFRFIRQTAWIKSEYVYLSAIESGMYKLSPMCNYFLSAMIFLDKKTAVDFDMSNVVPQV